MEFNLIQCFHLCKLEQVQKDLNSFEQECNKAGGLIRESITPNPMITAADTPTATPITTLAATKMCYSPSKSSKHYLHDIPQLQCSLSKVIINANVF